MFEYKQFCAAGSNVTNKLMYCRQVSIFDAHHFIRIHLRTNDPVLILHKKRAAHWQPFIFQTRKLTW